MYLSLLNNYQKSLFLSLALYLANTDSDYSKEEHEVIQSYCDEMNITENSFIPFTNITEIISKIDESSNTQEKKIVIFEAIGLAMIDNDYSDNEKKLIQLINTYFGFDETFIIKCEELVNRYLIFQKEINNHILNNE